MGRGFFSFVCSVRILSVFGTSSWIRSKDHNLLSCCTVSYVCRGTSYSTNAVNYTLAPVVIKSAVDRVRFTLRSL